MKRSYLITGLLVSALMHGALAALYLWTPWTIPQAPEGSPLELSLSMLQTMSAAPVAAPSPSSEQASVSADTPDRPPEPDAPTPEEREIETPPDAPEPAADQRIEERPRPKKIEPPRPETQKKPPMARTQDKVPQDAASTQAEAVRSAPERPSQTQQATSGQLTGKDASILLKYKQALVAAIERNKFYPRRAQRRRLEGTTVVVFVIDLKGDIRDIQIKQSSGHGLLDKTSLTAIQRIRRFQPLPETLGRNQIEFSIPLSYELKTSSIN